MNNTKDEFDYQVLNLTDDFFRDYPDPPYHEIARKKLRPYNCLLIQSHYGYFICVPYRSHINHKYAYRFKNSIRSKKNKSGLDYSKSIIITDSKYLGKKNAIVDKDEFNETRDNIEYIRNDVLEYIDDYINQVCGIKNKYDEVEFIRTYKYSTLQYFHNELGLSVSEKGRIPIPV